MNEQSYTYQNITISYSDAQKALVLADQNAIGDLNNQLISLQNQINYYEQVIANAKDQLDNVCNSLSNFPVKYKDQCIAKWNQAWNDARSTEDNITANIANINNTLLPNAKAKLNNDIITIQNDIKLQIQTQLANTAAATQAASNQVGINQTQPGVLTSQIQATSAAQILALQNQAAQDKLNQEKQIKIAVFFFIAVIVIGIAYIGIKKLT